MRTFLICCIPTAYLRGPHLAASSGGEIVGTIVVWIILLWIVAHMLRLGRSGRALIPLCPKYEAPADPRSPRTAGFGRSRLERAQAGETAARGLSAHDLS